MAGVLSPLSLGFSSLAFDQAKEVEYKYIELQFIKVPSTTLLIQLFTKIVKLC